MTDTLSPYLAARQNLGQALDREQDARDAWRAAPDGKERAAAWSKYTDAGIEVVRAEEGLLPFADQIAAGVARSRFYAQHREHVGSVHDDENLTVAAFLGPAEVPFPDEWIEFCGRAGFDASFDPGAAHLAVAAVVYEIPGFNPDVRGEPCVPPPCDCNGA